MCLRKQRLSGITIRFSYSVKLHEKKNETCTTLTAILLSDNKNQQKSRKLLIKIDDCNIILNMKKIFSIVVLIICCHLANAANIPVVVNSDEKVFTKISSNIANQLPKNVQILAYDICFLNMNMSLADAISNDFKTIMTNQQFINNYKIFFINEVQAQHPEIDYSFLNTLNDQELINFGQIVNADVVFISTATLIQDKQKSVWDNNLHKFVKKKVILFQANIFNTKTNAYLMRISEYFVVH